MDKILFYEEWLEFDEAMERIIQENNYSDDVASEKYKAGWDFFLSEFVKDKSEYINSNLDPDWRNTGCRSARSSLSPNSPRA